MSEPFDPDMTTMFTTPSTTPPGPGWWRADDGEWYPPETPPITPSPGPGYWMASDGRWYPPGPEETTAIPPVPQPNSYEGWQPEPQPHDQITASSPSPATAAVGGASDEIDIPTWAKIIGTVFVLLFLAAIALTALDISI